MSFTRRNVPINNENDAPVDLHAASRPGKRSILHDVSVPEKRQRFTKTRTTTTTGGPRRALGDVTNRVNIKKASVSAMGSSAGAAGALAKKKQIASKRSISNVNVSSRSVGSTASTRSIGSSVSSRNFGNVNVTSRHVGSSSTSSINSFLSRPLSATTHMSSTLGSLGLADKTTPMFNIQKMEEKEDHDIDSEDKNDPTMCSQYAEDITKYQLQAEKSRKPSSAYMARQSDINAKMRAILVDWLVDVHYKYGLLPQTLHIAVHLIDRYLESNLSVRRQRLQLVGVSAMFIAAKYEEIYPPEADNFVKITDNAYTKNDVFKMEADMLAAISYRVTFPTAFQFMKRFLKASRTCDDRVENFAHYVVDRSLQEYKLIKYLPSTIAAAAVHIARTQMRDTPAWSSTLEYHSSYSEHSLSPCIEELKEILWNTRNNVGKMSKLNAARRKFSKERFMGVAAEPLEFSKSA